jgi:hypothetical protein
MSDSIHTGEFDPGIGKRGVGNAVSVYQNKLWVMGSGSDSQLYQTTFTFSGKPDEWGLTNKKNWQNPVISLANFTNPKSYSKCGSDVQGDQSALYLFWMTNSYFMSASTSAGNATGSASWSEGYVLLNTAGKLLLPRSHGADVSAVAFGTSSFIVAFPIEYDEPQKGTRPAIYLGLFSVADQNLEQLVDTPDGHFPVWPAHAELVVPPDVMSAFPQKGSAEVVTFLDPGRSISITWFPFIPAEGAQPVFYLLAFLTPTMSKQSQQNFPWPIQLLLPLDPGSGAPLVSGAGAPLVMFNDMIPQSGFAAARDPAGRIFGYAMGNKKVEALPYSTYTVPTTPPAVTSDNPAGSASGTEPTAAFYVDGVNTASPVGPNPSAIQTAYNVYRFLFYGGDHVVTQVDYFGQVQTLVPYTANLVPNAKPPTRVTGIIEGPLPIPKENVIGFGFGNKPVDCGDISFTTQSGDTDSLTAQVSAGVGYQTQGSIAVGAGFAWNVSVQANYVHNWNQQSNTTYIYGITQNSLATETGVIPDGGFVGTPPPVLILTPYRFVDVNGNVIGDPTSTADTDQAARFFSITLATNANVRQVFEYVPFMVTPGNLPSYTPEEINTTMAALYKAKSIAKDWTDYFQEVVLANAYKFGGIPYLQFTRSLSTTTQGGFSQNSSSFTSNGFNFSASAYAGIAVNADIPGGFGGFNSTTMAGFQVTANTNVGSGTTSQTGIMINSLDGIPMWADPDDRPDGIFSYTFLLFYLPPPKSNPNLWATELAAFAQPNPKTTVDPGSQPWKILFVVYEYQTGADFVNGQLTYRYTGNLAASKSA